jgi:hypothetical protein
MEENCHDPVKIEPAPALCYDGQLQCFFRLCRMMHAVFTFCPTFWELCGAPGGLLRAAESLFCVLGRSFGTLSVRRWDFESIFSGVI